MKMQFNEENKQKSDFDFPKLYLEHGERARIVCIETEPEVGFVHTIKAPQIMNGSLVMEKVRAKDGTITEKPKYDFIGRHMCFGNPETLFKSAKDPEGCPTCAEAQQSEAILPPQRRFAMHVVKYKTQAGTFNTQTPFQAELVVWTFNDKYFNTLTDISGEHGDLRQKDLLLGPCENKMFQNFDIQVGGSAKWLEAEENTNFVKTLYAGNKVESLSDCIARKKSREQAAEDVQKAQIKHAQAFGGGEAAAGAANVAGAAGMGHDLNDLLGNGGSSTPTPEPTPAPDLSTQAAPEATPAPVQETVPDMGLDVPTPAAEPETKPALDLDDLMKGIG